MNEWRCPAPGWRLEGEAVGAGGTLPAPPAPWPPATQGGTPAVCCLCPSQAVGTTACTRVPPSTCGLRASCLCRQPGPGRTPAFLCLRPLCPLWVPEALPGPELEGRFPLDSRLVPAVPSPTSGRGPKALSPGSAGPVGRVGRVLAGWHSVPRSCRLGVGGYRQGLSGPRRTDVRLSPGPGPARQGARPQHTAGTELGGAVSTRDAPPELLDPARKSTGRPLGLRCR